VLALWVRNWWVLGLRGFVALSYGLTALLWSDASAIILMLLLGAYALVDGVLGMVVALEKQDKHPTHIPLFLEGAIGIVVGVLTFVWPKPAVPMFLGLIAAWALASGILEIIVAAWPQKMKEAGWFLVLRGGALLAFGLMLINWPDINIEVHNHSVGVCIIVLGALSAALSVRLRNWSGRMRSGISGAG
jgi:uncharacterized membrane protein HdeD (DUF308 family)